MYKILIRNCVVLLVLTLIAVFLVKPAEAGKPQPHATPTPSTDYPPPPDDGSTILTEENTYPAPEISWLDPLSPEDRNSTDTSNPIPLTPIGTTMVHNPAGTQWESYPAVSPCNYNNMAVGMNYAVNTNGQPADYDAAVAVSSDGGVSWNIRIIPGFPHTSQGDPSVVYTAAPTCRLIYKALSYTGTSSNGIYVATSDNNGSSWSTPTALDVRDIYHSTDRGLLYADPNSQKVMAVWIRDMFSFKSTYFSTSNDGGQTWSQPALVTAEASGYSSAAPSPYIYNGRLYATEYYLGSTGMQMRVYFETSPGSNTFASRTISTHSGWSLRTSPYIAASDTRLYIIWGDDTSLYYSYSTDQGNSWAYPLVYALGDSDTKWVNPILCTTFTGDVVAGGYRYQYSTNQIQMFIGKMSRYSLLPLGPSMNLIGNWDYHQVYRQFGDYNGCVKGRDPYHPGIVVSITTSTSGQSIPAGPTSDTNSNVEAAAVPTVLLNVDQLEYLPIIVFR